MKQPLNHENLILNKSQLLDFFFSGIKPVDKFSIGIEFEKLGVDAYTYRAIPYSGQNGILEFLKKYKEKTHSKYLHEDNSILGIQLDSYGFISLEPGSQLEFSSFPTESLHEISSQLNFYNKYTSYLAEEDDIYWLGYGIQPVSTHTEIELIPKKRYSIMTEYLPTKADLPLVMMRETAGIQAAVDYSSEEDAINKLRVSLGISPIVTAMFSNSPIRSGQETGYKSYRAYSWLNTDHSRCGLISKKIFNSPEEFNFSDYVNILLDLPMIFLNKNNKWINMNGLTFREYLENGFEGYRATIEDWNLHMSSFFPDVRLKNFLELRNSDCQKADLITAIPALWKGVMYNQDALNAAWDLVKDLSWEDRLEFREIVPKYALSASINGRKVSDMAKELVNIAEISLKTQSQLNENNQDESIYLDNLKELVYNSETPADQIIKFWNSDWNKNLEKLIEYSRLT